MCMSESTNRSPSFIARSSLALTSRFGALTSLLASAASDVAGGVVGHMREPWTEATDDGRQPLIERLGRRVDGLQPLARRLGVARQHGEIDRGQASILHDHPPADHDVPHRAAVLGVDELVGGVVGGNPVGMLQVEEYDVGEVAGRQPAELAREAQRPRAALGGRHHDLVGRDPSVHVRAAALGHEGGQAHGLEHVLVVRAVGAVGADAHVHAPLEHGLHVAEAVAQPHVAARVVRHRGAVVAQALHVVVVKPHAVGDREVRPERTQTVEMRGERLAVALQPDDGLHLGLGHVAMQADAVLLGQGRAAADELVRAVMRDGRRHREADLLTIERPAVQSRAHPIDAGLPRHRL